MIKITNKRYFNPLFLLGVFFLYSAGNSVKAAEQSGAVDERMSDATPPLAVMSPPYEDYKPARAQPPSGEVNAIGFDLNFPRFLLLPNGTNHSEFSGGLSYFDNKRGTEIAIPIFHGESHSTRYSSKIDYEVTTIDIHYRNFFDYVAEGVFFSAFLRSTYQRGTPFGPSYPGINSAKSLSDLKFGAGAGLGYRVVFGGKVYWGMSFSLGRYFNNKSRQFEGADSTSFLDDIPLIFDIEFAKVGFIF